MQLQLLLQNLDTGIEDLPPLLGPLTVFLQQHVCLADGSFWSIVEEM